MASRVTLRVSFELPDKLAAQWRRETPCRWDILSEISKVIKQYWDNDERLMAVEIMELLHDGGVRSTEDSGTPSQDGLETPHRYSTGGID